MRSSDLGACRPLATKCSRPIKRVSRGAMEAKSKNIVYGAVAAGALLAGSALTPDAHADTAAAPESDSLVEITVTARRRDESIHDTPVAVTALNTAMLEAKGTTNIGDLQGAMPNVLITNEPAGPAAANI